MLLDMPLGGGDGVKELYDSERAAIVQIRNDMMTKHGFRGVTTVKEEDDVKRRITNEIRERCQDIGFVVEVEWSWESEEKDEDGIPLRQSPCASADPKDMNLYWLPNVVIIGRTEKLAEFDHEKQQSEVVSGLLDGKAGYLREDGTFREDAKRKNIY